MLGIVGGDDLGNVAGELPDGVEVGVTRDRRHDVQPPEPVVCTYGTRPRSSSTSATVGRRYHDREVAARGSRSKTIRSGLQPVARDSHACTVTQF